MADDARRRARRAYELGRLRAALPWTAWPVAIAAASLALGDTSALFAVLAGAALALGVLIARWAGGAAARAASSGLAVGTAAFAVLQLGLAMFCGEACAAFLPSAVCIGVGLGAGLAVGALARGRARPALFGAAAFAVACAALGCATAGLAAMLGLAVATLVAAAPWMIVGAPSRA